MTTALNLYRAFIRPERIMAEKLYDVPGFADAGHGALAEAFWSSGDESILHADGGKVPYISLH